MHLAVRLACAASRISAADVTAEINRCFEEVGALVVNGDGLTTAHSRFPRVQPEMFTDESLSAVLSSVQSVLSNARMESDRSAEEKSRVCGSLLVMAMSFTAAESIPQVWIDTGGWNTIARLLKDENLSDSVAELVLTAVASRLAFGSSQVHLPAIMGARFSFICISLFLRRRDRPRVRLAATTLLCNLCCNADPDGLRRLIADGAVLALVQMLQHPRDDNSTIASEIVRALEQVSTLPEGRAALQHQDVRRALNIAVQRQYAESVPFDSHISSLIYGDGDQDDDFPLTHEVTVMIDTCLNHIRAGWVGNFATTTTFSAWILSDLCVFPSYSDEATRLDAVTTCVDAVRACQRLRADYWLQDGFTSILHALFAMAWKDTARGKTARARFIQLGGLPLLIEVLGDGSADAKPITVVYTVCLVLFSLAKAVDSVHAVRALSAAAKNAIRQSLSVHAAYLNSQDWWVKQKGSETLLRVLAG